MFTKLKVNPKPVIAGLFIAALSVMSSPQTAAAGTSAGMDCIDPYRTPNASGYILIGEIFQRFGLGDDFCEESTTGAWEMLLEEIWGHCVYNQGGSADRSRIINYRDYENDTLYPFGGSYGGGLSERRERAISADRVLGRVSNDLLYFAGRTDDIVLSRKGHVPSPVEMIERCGLDPADFN